MDREDIALEHWSKKVSFIIPMYNEEDYIVGMLESIYDQSYPLSLIEVILVDGGSQDLTLKKVENFIASHQDLKIDILHNEKRVTPTALNIGLKHAKGDYLVLSTAHGWITSEYIKNSLETFVDADDKVIGVGGILLTEPKEKTYMARIISYVRSSKFGVGGGFRSKTGKPERYYAHTIPKPMFKREVIEKNGYYDEDIIRTQDLDYNRRILQNGYKLLFNSKIESGYYARQTFGKFITTLFHTSKWTVFLMRKYKTLPNKKYMIPFVFLLVHIFLIIVGMVFSISCAFALYGILLLIYITYGASIVQSENRKIKLGDKAAFFLVAYLGHISYGAGFLYGLLYKGFKHKDKEGMHTR